LPLACNHEQEWVGVRVCPGRTLPARASGLVRTMRKASSGEFVNCTANKSQRDPMTKKERILRCVLSAVDELNEGLPRAKQLGKTPEVVLFGEQGSLDSLGLATLVVLSEQRVEEEFGHAVTVADERAMSQHRSPFRTIETMADYITLLVEEERN
jgi:hypothetical protein